MLLLMLTMIALVGGGALIWYLSNNSEFTRADASASAPSKPIAPVPNPKPHAIPVR